ncbi:MAG: hypothetical protein ABSG53_15850 [Thermoguttaceae bacterium]|jgi:hypothetical protein
MNQPRPACDGFPLFQGDPDVWNSLDKPTQEQVLDCLAMLLLRHLQQTARDATEGRLLMKGYST